jgi:hypothetical protein
MTMSGGKGLEDVLRKIEAGVSKGKGVHVGFLENATYPDGTKVAMVAAIQNYGAPAASIPARPFFSGMVREKSPGWGDSLTKVLKSTDYDAKQALGLMGEGIKGQLQQSIADTDAPALSQITLMLRKMRSEDQSLVVTGKTVGEAARRVAEGESTAGVSTKPLDDTGHMKASVDYEVDV